MESLMKDVGDCGLFQVLAVNIQQLGQLLFAFSMVFLSFGIYNPGWSCADNIFNNTTEPYYGSVTTNLSTSPSINATVNDLTYNEESCQVFESCRDVRFNPESSTLVTEWGLVCGRAWIVNVIISIQMISILVGSLFTGYFSDKFGRKYTLLSCFFLHTVIHFVSIFSVSWEMFAMTRVFVGIVVAFFRFLPFVYSSEFISRKWRGPVASHPMYTIAATMTAVICMVTKNWVQVEIAMTSVSAIAFISMLWIPESLRWLVVNEKEKEAYRVAAKIAKMNGKEAPDRVRVQDIVKNFTGQVPSTKKHRVVDLFRKGFRMPTSIIAFLYIVINITYHAISIGVKALPGNIYTNMILLACAELMSNGYAALTGNKFGRRMSVISSLSASAVCIMGVVAFDRLASGSVQDIGITVLAISVVVFNNIAWYMLTAYMTELYPTIIRGTITGWASVHAQIGAIIGPFLIPSAPEYFYICYLIMGCLCAVNCVLLFLLKDTSNKPLDDTWKTDASSKDESQDAEDVLLDTKSGLNGNVENDINTRDFEYPDRNPIQQANI